MLELLSQDAKELLLKRIASRGQESCISTLARLTRATKLISSHPLRMANLPLCGVNYASTVRVMRDKRIKFFLKLAIV